MPDKISKFLPSKVMIPGFFLLIKSQSNTSSTGILIMCKIVSVPGLSESRNRLPFFVMNNNAINTNTGITASINFGGIVCVFV